MKPDDKLLKKKKKRPSRFVRLILVTLFIIAVVSLIFYSVDNPGFIPSIKDKLIGFYTSDENSTTDSSAIESDNMGSDNTSISTESSSESVGDTTVSSDTVTEKQTNNIFMLLWQKIIGFFIKKTGKDADKFPDKLKIKAYFAGIGQDQKFVFEERTIFAGDPKIAVTNAVKELINGPTKSYHFPVIPSGTKLLGVDIYENFAKINFSQDFLQNSLESGVLDEYVIYTIVNTVTEIPEIEGVIFLIEGVRIKIYGKVDLSIPAIRNEEYLSEETSES
jgi:spore germination protein GerM